MARSIKVLAALAVAGASIFCAASQASADPNPNNTGYNPIWIPLTTSHYVGVYTAPDAGSGKWNNLTLAPHTSKVYADCWVAGGNVGSDGDVWYHTTYVQQSGWLTYTGDTWTFAPYVDSATQFHNVPGLPRCP
ncbi:hypothetical protein ABZX88_32350 [Kitasatospora aureofaciens]|uniref:hypothetical protein n=1 Tax=Kitasatospora aureofaciens TaxID=1894 RepID=UPI0033A9BD18